MPKTDISKIFKNGKNFKLTEVDWTDPKNIKALLRVKQQQEEIENRKNVNWVELDKFYINI